jgi:hypothetical protein
MQGKRQAKAKAEDLHDLEREELSGHDDEHSSLSTSSTDEDEGEGLGDGNIGRSDRNILGK